MPQAQAQAAPTNPSQRVCDVPHEHIERIWPLARAHIKRALDREGSGRFEPVDILALLLEHKARLWVAWNAADNTIEAAAVTDISQGPRFKELRIWLVGGRNIKAWVVEMRDMIEAFARANGCHFITGAMRKGWIRIGGSGWRETGVTFEKKL